jgi:lipoprotein-anchoring transpeptidase ErfK/SrfK
LDSPTRAGRLLATITATILLLLSASMAWATAYEYRARTVIPDGVTVAGQPLGGLDAAQAAEVIERAVTQPLMRPVQVFTEGQTFSYDPKGAVRVDTETMIDQAFQPRRESSFASRLRHEFGRVPFTTEIEPAYSVDASAVAAWVRSVAGQVDTPAADATVTVASGVVTITPSALGRSTSINGSVAAIREAFSSDKALSQGDRSVTLVVDKLKPAVTEEDLGKTIVVDLSLRRIWLYDGAKVEKVYRCAIGTPAHPTPTGNYTIVEKRKWPSWSNPAPNGWGKDMPAYIPPGPSNPLGTRALNLSASGIRFHGTTKSYSIGTAASHGCMRMYRHDIEDFFERVEVGTNVYIFP